MSIERLGHAIGASLIGLVLVLAAPSAGTSQETVRCAIPADRPLSYHLSALHGNSWLTSHGIWLRHEGMWAFRPTSFRNPQAVLFSSWLPYGYAGWDLVPGGWMWFPGCRLATNRAWDLFWDLWTFPRYGLGFRGYGWPLRLLGGSSLLGQSAFLHRWDLLQGSERPWAQRGGQTYEDWWREFLAEGGFTGDSDAQDRTKALIDPVRNGPVVMLSPDGNDSGQAGRTAPTTPSIDPVRLGPRVESRAVGASSRTAPQKPKGKSRDPLDRGRHKPAAPSATKRPKSPRAPTTGTPATGRSKPKGKTVPE